MFGHTHVPKMLTRHSLLGAVQAIYANTGYLCADIPGMEDQRGYGRYMTFCETTRIQGALTVKILKVDYVTGTVSQLGNLSQTVSITS